MNIKDILKQCKEQIKSFTEEDIKNLKKNYDSMPDNKYYEPPREIELVYSYENVKKLMNSIIENTTEGTLKHEVAQILLDEMVDIECDEEIMRKLNDIVNSGCVSGVVSSMIYTKDTEAFFDRHVDEIFDLLNERRTKDWDLNYVDFSRNNLAWFSFEIVSQEIYYEVVKEL